MAVMMRFLSRQTANHLAPMAKTPKHVGGHTPTAKTPKTPASPCHPAFFGGEPPPSPCRGNAERPVLLGRSLPPTEDVAMLDVAMFVAAVPESAPSAPEPSTWSTEAKSSPAPLIDGFPVLLGGAGQKAIASHCSSPAQTADASAGAREAFLVRMNRITERHGPANKEESVDGQWAERCATRQFPVLLGREENQAQSGTPLDDPPVHCATALQAREAFLARRKRVTERKGLVGV
mmetsp:Transcript_81739/g.210477  ORF Transcript_81739/g.210477 Transcript_81739/m.210477 type:complete len:234 (-) Transcript_81739:33-734(-)